MGAKRPQSGYDPKSRSTIVPILTSSIDMCWRETVFERDLFRGVHTLECELLPCHGSIKDRHLLEGFEIEHLGLDVSETRVRIEILLEEEYYEDVERLYPFEMELLDFNTIEARLQREKDLSHLSLLDYSPQYFGFEVVESRNDEEFPLEEERLLPEVELILELEQLLEEQLLLQEEPLLG